MIQWHASQSILSYNYPLTVAIMSGKLWTQPCRNEELFLSSIVCRNIWIILTEGARELLEMSRICFLLIQIAIAVNWRSIWETKFHSMVPLQNIIDAKKIKFPEQYDIKLKSNEFQIEYFHKSFSLNYYIYTIFSLKTKIYSLR